MEALKAENTPRHKLYTEIEELKERNRLLLIKSREERQALQNKISELEYRDESQSRRLKEKQARLGELEAQIETLTLKAKNEELRTARLVANFELPDAADLLNQLKAKRKKSTTSLADVETILGILEELTLVGGD